MLTISLNPIKAQEVSVSLAGQAVTLRITQQSYGLFMDIGIDDKWIAQGVLCLNTNKMVRYKHLGFKGELFFGDTKGSEDPVYDELGSRFKLFYATEEEMAA